MSVAQLLICMTQISNETELIRKIKCHNVSGKILFRVHFDFFYLGSCPVDVLLMLLGGICKLYCSQPSEGEQDIMATLL